jgi:hypothetical protein
MMRLCHFVAACLLLVSSLNAVVSATSSEISYVMDPFEFIADNWFTTVYNDNGKLNLTTTSSSNATAFGKSALRVEYQVQQTETWGGYVDFGVLSVRAHNCRGATHMSLWYKVLQPQSAAGRVHLRLILLDDSDCLVGQNCTDQQNLEQYYSFHYILDDATADWQELQVKLRGNSDSDSPFWQTGWSGTTGNGVLDLDHIRGWRIEMNIDSQGVIGNTSQGAFLVDQLACVGGGELFGAAFRSKNATFDDAIATGTWAENYYDSPLSMNRTERALDDGNLIVNYTIEQVETWGGYVDYEHLAPGPAYYNLSQASDLSLNYEMIRPASSSGRAHLRIILMDGSDCAVDCDVYPGSNLEQYYSFHYILDGDSPTVGTGDVTVALAGNGDSASPFWRTGWSGVVGNDVLDTSIVKGFRLELNLDSQGEVGSLVSGELSLGNMTAVPKAPALNGAGGKELTKCIVEPDFQFDTEQEGVRRVEFLAGQCCETCDADKDCLYAQSDNEHCYMASSIDPSSVGLVNTEISQSSTKVFWMDDSAKRGDFCTLCECNATDRTIDCRGRDLKTIPKTFSSPANQATLWTPRMLDLRDNPHLVLLGSGALKSISETLEELRLPVSLRHMTLASVQNLPLLKSVVLEDDKALSSEASHYQLNNVLTQSSGFFGDVCCSRGAHISLLSPSDGLTFCDMKIHSPGVDAVYEQFVEYYDAEELEVLRPSSSFMSEAAESAHKCAEYCSIQDGCKFFSYDTRWKNAEPICYLLGSIGTPSEVCCKPDDYADTNGTAPGWTSGRVPRTRHGLDNARVLITSQNLVVDRANNYTSQFVLSLGSTPLRGAVWIEPTLASTTKYSVSFSPQRVALYDNTTTATIVVTVSNVNAGSTSDTIVISNTIRSCDAAFITSSSLSEETILYIHAVVTSSSNVQWLAIVVPCAIVLVIALVYLYVEHKRRQADSVWIVKPSELHFGDPPEVIGRGTFGLVILAEYRGTQVAVKRVIPPRVGQKHKWQVASSRFDRGPLVVPDNNESVECQRVSLDSVTSGPRNTSSSKVGSTNQISDVEAGTMGSLRRSRVGTKSGAFDGAGTVSYRRKTNSRRFFFRSGMKDHYSRLKADFIEEMRHLSKLRHPCITTVMGTYPFEA